MICPSCGARNPNHADWCSQCFTVFATPSNGTSPSGASDGTGDVGSPARPTAGVSRSPGADRDIRLRGDDVEWRCARCGGWTALHVTPCAVCGAPRRGFAGSDEQHQVHDLDQRVVVGASLLVPGAGHLLHGAVGSGVARVVLWLLWFGAGIALVRDGASTGALVLLSGAGLLWAATALDAAALTAGRRQLLGARALGALALVVTAGLLLTTLRTAVGA